MMSDLVTLAACWTLYYLFACFFFSSRRRHTRWPRDWSSDVCSSDLSVGDAFSLRDGKSSYGEGQWATSIRYHDGRVRSEERRVGKEGSDEWVSAQEEK